MSLCRPLSGASRRDRGPVTDLPRLIDLRRLPTISHHQTVARRPSIADAGVCVLVTVISPSRESPTYGFRKACVCAEPHLLVHLEWRRRPQSAHLTSRSQRSDLAPQSQPYHPLTAISRTCDDLRRWLSSSWRATPPPSPTLLPAPYPHPPHGRRVSETWAVRF